MNETDQIRLLIVWLVVAVLGLIAIAIVIVWAIRGRQFSDQDRARYLALRAGIPPDRQPADGARPRGKSQDADRSTSADYAD
jgi:nitrogen fixation-related uncharacterized protein